MTILLALIATGLSTLALCALCIGDPKRNRATGSRAGGQTRRKRLLLAFATCLPGLICALTGDAAAFLIWLGGCGVMGWSLAIWFNRRAQEAD